MDGDRDARARRGRRLSRFARRCAASICAPPARIGRARFPSAISPRRRACNSAASARAPDRVSSRRRRPAPAHRLAQANRVRPRHRASAQLRRRDVFEKHADGAAHRDHRLAPGRICRARLRRSGLPDHFHGPRRPRCHAICIAGSARRARLFPTIPAWTSCGATGKSAGTPASRPVRCRASSRCSIPASTQRTRTWPGTSCCSLSAQEAPHSQGGRLNARCATSGRCYPHGTEMAGTIGGRMDNGIGVAGVAPNSRLLPIVISRVDRGLLARISTIAAGIDAAVEDGAEIINISAKWPVDSRAISEAIVAAVGGRRGRPAPGGHRLRHQPRPRRHASGSTSRPSTAACPGVIAAVPDRYARPRIVQS